MQETMTRSRPIPGVDQSTISEAAGLLNRNLANLMDLAASYKQAHWNILGPRFAALHELFDTFTDQTREYVDEVAERCVAIGGTAHGTLQCAARETAMPEFPLEERDEQALLRALSDRLDTVAQELRRGAEATERDVATQDVFIEALRGIEKQRWMLQAHIV